MAEEIKNRNQFNNRTIKIEYNKKNLLDILILKITI